MSMPDVGCLIATRYNVVVFNISERLMLTLPPLKGKVPPPIQRTEIGIAFVNQDHFVQGNIHINSVIRNFNLNLN